MSRTAFSMTVPDVAAFARALAAALQLRHSQGQPLPGHVTWLNLIARAVGVRNVQTLRALPRLRPSAEEAAAPPPLSEHARKALALFDTRGRLTQWPAKRSVQQLCMWVLWLRFERDRPYTEAEVNAVLKAAHTFGDHATLRRELINDRLLARTDDCREYRKLPRRASDEARALMQAWRALQRG